MPVTIEAHPSQFASFIFGGFNAADQRFPFGIINGSASVDDTSKAYIADLGPVVSANSTGNVRRLAVVPKTAAPVGGSFSVTITMNASDAASGQTLTATTQVVIFDGASAPPPNTTTGEVQPDSVTFGPLSSAPADPGTSAISWA